MQFRVMSAATEFGSSDLAPTRRNFDFDSIAVRFDLHYDTIYNV